MRIVPKDLGLAWHVRLVLARDSINKVGAEAPEPHLGVVGSLCTSEMGLDEKTAAALAPAAKETLSWCVVPFLPALPLATLSSVVLFVAMNWPREFLPFYLGAWVLGAAATGIGWARARFRRLVEAPLTPEEVERLLE